MRNVILLAAVIGGIIIPACILNGCATASNAEIESHFSKLRVTMPRDAVMQKDQKNETVILLKGDNLSETLEQDPQIIKFQKDNRFSDIALAFLTAHRSLFKLERPSDELVIFSTETDHAGFKHLKFRQYYKAIAIWASELIVHLDQANHIYHIQGRYIPTPVSVYTTAVLTCENAVRKAAEHVKSKDTKCSDCRCDQVIYADEANPTLAYRVVITPSLIEGWIMLVDAQTGKILKKISTVHTGGVQGRIHLSE